MTTANRKRLETEAVYTGPFTVASATPDERREGTQTTLATTEKSGETRWILIRGSVSGPVTFQYAPDEEARKRANRRLNRGARTPTGSR